MRDILDAAHFRGELVPAWKKFLNVQAAAARAEEEEREGDDAAIDTAVQTFRYDHDLITAEETEAWLAERGLTLSDFSEYFTRQYWGEALGGGKTEAADYFVAPAETREVFLAELIFSGELGRMATRLSWRLAAAASTKAAPEREALETERQKFIERLAPVSLAEWARHAGRDEAWIDQMALLEATFRLVCDSVLSPQARKREVSTLRLQLTMFELEILEVDSRDAAREAFLCVRDDGMTMEEVAMEGRYPFHREEMVLEDIAPEMQPQFLSVTPGKVMEPMDVGGAHRLCRVVAKHEPNPEDAAVHRRIEQRLLERHFADAVLQHVRWDLALS